MSATFRKRNSAPDFKDIAQDNLLLHLSEEADCFFSRPDIAEMKLDESEQIDVYLGSLLTLAANQMAFNSVAEKDLDSEPYLQGVFDAMRTLFETQRKEFLKKSSRSKKAPLDEKKDPSLH